MGLHCAASKIVGSHWQADADGIGLGSYTKVADVDIVIARGKIPTGGFAQRDIPAAACVAKERVSTVGRVEAARCVAKEPLATGGRVGEAGVKSKRRSTISCVVPGSRVGLECETTSGRG